MAIVPNTSTSDYSPTWKWVDDEQLEGTHVEFRKAPTADRGEVVVWEIASDEHGPVSVWVEPANLKLKVRREFKNRARERGSAHVEPGERIRINPGTKRPSKKNPSQTVWPFSEVWFEHAAPDLSAEELLLAEPDDESETSSAAANDETEEEGADGGDIPF